MKTSEAVGRIGLDLRKLGSKGEGKRARVPAEWFIQAGDRLVDCAREIVPMEYERDHRSESWHVCRDGDVRQYPSALCSLCIMGQGVDVGYDTVERLVRAHAQIQNLKADAEMEKSEMEQNVENTKERVNRYYSRVEPRPEIRAFARMMEYQLQANHHKGTWKELDEQYLFRRLIEEVGEVAEALQIERPKGLSGKLMFELADVANFCMMLIDIHGGLDG